MRYRKAFVTITIVILSSFFVTVLVAMNSFNSQIKFANERNIMDKQVYYNAYAGLQKGLLLISQDFDCSVQDTFSVVSNGNAVGASAEKFYTDIKVQGSFVSKTEKAFEITSTGYGRFKQSLLSQTLVGTVIVDTSETEGVLRFESIELR